MFLGLLKMSAEGKVTPAHEGLRKGVRRWREAQFFVLVAKGAKSGKIG